MEDLVAELRAIIAEKDRQIEALRARVQELEEKVAKLQRDSSNSSKPPSSDGPTSRRRGSNVTPAKKKRRKRGGQLGRKHAKRELLPADKEEVCRPETCTKCAADLTSAKTIKSSRFQQIDVPPVTAVVTDFIQETVSCGSCGSLAKGALPPIAKVGFLGPQLASIVAMMTGKYRLSKREVVRILRDLTKIEISLGSVCNTERRVAAAVHEPVLDALKAVRSSRAVHMDETGWRQGRKKAWLWLATTVNLAIFGVSKSRGTKSAVALIGADFGGTLITDRWGAYGFIPPERRQLCWAHLKRDFQGWVDLGGKGSHYGLQLLDEINGLFRGWHQYGQKTLSLANWVGRAKASRERCKKILRRAVYYGQKTIRGAAKFILRREESLWHFVESEGVSPTNNHAERVLRPAVLWRKGCFGNDSPRGSQYVARILSVAATLRLQKRAFLPFVQHCLLARASGQTYPSLASAG